MTGAFSSRSVADKRKDLLVITAALISSAVLLAFYFVLDGISSKAVLATAVLSALISLLLGGTYPVYYVYTVDGDDLSVDRISGRTSKRVCLIGVNEITSLVTDVKSKRGKVRRYDYRGALFTRETLRIEFDNGYESGVLLLTCDGAFIAELKALFELYSKDLIE